MKVARVVGWAAAALAVGAAISLLKLWIICRGSDGGLGTAAMMDSERDLPGSHPSG